MATFDMKAFTPEGGMDDEKNTRKMASYLYQLTEQLRFVLQNLDDENLSEGLIGELNDIKNNLNIVIGDVSGVHTEINQTSEKIELKADKAVTDALGNRMANAESTLSVQAGQIATKVSQTDLSSTLANYSTLTQTANSITAAVGEINIGGANLKSGTSNTAATLSTYPGSAGVSKYEYGDDYPDKWCRYSVSDGTFFRVFFNAKLTPGKVYTMSADVLDYLSRIRIGVASPGHGESFSGYQSWDNTTKRLSYTFTAQTAEDWMCVDCERRSGSSGTFYFDIRKVKVEEGNKATAWCQSDEELVNSAVEITPQATRIATPILDIDVTGEDGDTKIDENGLSTGVGTFKTVNCPTVVQKSKYSNSTINGANGLQAYFETYINGRMIDGSFTLTLGADQSGDVIIKGVIGCNAVITINGQNHAINGQLKIVDCNLRSIVFNNTTFNCNDKPPFVMQGARYVSINTCTINTNNQNGIAAEAGSFFDIYDVGIYNANSALYVWMGCVATILYVKGTATNAITSRGAWINWAGSRTSGALGAWASLLNPTNLTNIPINTGTAPQPPVVVTTKTYNTSNTGTSYPTDHWLGDSIIRQGYSTLSVGNEKLYGCMWFSGASELRGKTIKSASLTVSRISGKGRSGAVDVALYTSSTTGKSGTLANFTEIGSLGSMGNGETKTFNIPTTAIAAIANGGCFVFYTGETALVSGKQYSPHYAHFENAVLTVTY